MVVRVAPVFTRTVSIVAPGMMAPFWSRTRPLIVTLSRSCGQAVAGSAKFNASKSNPSWRVETTEYVEAVLIGNRWIQDRSASHLPTAWGYRHLAKGQV